ncbi:MAG: GNAT family N-acetyltransferase [Saprospiraceae bacterium]|nr:GNAT family N-acetyltransferase [Saprospiraceae bacterium]
MTIFVETERFLLRELVEADAQGLYELDSDPEVHRYLGNRPVTSIDSCFDIVQHVRRQYRENGIGRWAIEDKATNAFVGWAGLKYEMSIRVGAPYYDLGYRIIRRYWNQGIATETALASLHYGFHKLNLPTIFAAAHLDNKASNKILVNLGFSRIETFKLDDAVHNWYELNSNNFLSPE